MEKPSKVQILQMRFDKMSVDEIAKKTGLDKKEIREILKSYNNQVNGYMSASAYSTRRRRSKR